MCLVDHFLPFRNLMRMADMLSSPFSSSLLFLETRSDSSSSRMLPRLFLGMRALIQPTISPLDLDYQMPSQPMIRKSSPSFLILVISGLAVIICSSAGRFLQFLYSKSPIARDRFRLPLIRPSSTVPPAFTILVFSNLSSGLWSRLSSLASPLRLQTTARESPRWASFYLREWSVTCVGDVDELRSDEADVGGAASMRLLFILGSVFLVSELLLYLCDLVLALVGLQHLVHLEEGFLECQLVVLLHVVLVDLQLMDEMLAHENGHLGP